MAVTQGADSFLIKALTDVGRGEWFEVVERGGLDNLTKERLIIRQMREAYEGANAKPLMPMQFAGIILEGGIIGYDASTTSGGAGMRIFGIGKQTQWSTDTVTVSLRAVSVNTGKVIASVTVQKTILSTADSATALKFFDNATQAFEAEAGLTINEPGTYAVKAATEMAVVELIKEGQRKGVWDFKQEQPVAVAPPVELPKIAPVISSEVKQEVKQEAKQEVKPEVKVEEKKDVVVQPQTKSETKTEAAPSAATEVKKEEPKALFGQRTLKENSFLYVSENEASTRRWWIPKGTVVDVKQPGIEGWWRVTMADGTGRGGWIQNSKLGN
jgi:curli biogenesis system outer membrane secretion channel CsgG